MPGRRQAGLLMAIVSGGANTTVFRQESRVAIPSGALARDPAMGHR